MAIKTGRYGQVLYDPSAITPVALISIDGWKMSQKTPMEDVTCFSDTNKVYVPGMKDLSGSLTGRWNSSNVVLFQAVDASTPGKLKLVPNTQEGTFFWSGLAYLDADIDCSVQNAPKVAANFSAAGPWTMAP